MKWLILFVVLKEDFFQTQCRLQCAVAKFCAFPGADTTQGVDKALSEDLVDVGQGVRISRPVEAYLGLRDKGSCYIVSVSHHGVVAVGSVVEVQVVIQFHDLMKGKVVEVGVEQLTQAAFYDDSVIILTWGKPLRAGEVQSLFDTTSFSYLHVVGGTKRVECCTDVASLHVTRTLYYLSVGGEPHRYSVDTGVDIVLELGMRATTFGSLTGIWTGVSAVFREEDDWNMYALRTDGSVYPLTFKGDGSLTTVFPSAKAPTNLKDAVFKLSDDLYRRRTKIDSNHALVFELLFSVVRIYQDVFLVYDAAGSRWVFVRIVVL